MKCLALSEELAMALSQDGRYNEWSNELDGADTRKA